MSSSTPSIRYEKSEATKNDVETNNDVEDIFTNHHGESGHGEDVLISELKLVDAVGVINAGWMKKDAESGEEETNEDDDVEIPCKYCDQYPCIKDADNLFVEMMEVAQSLEDGGEEDNSKIRYALYTFVSMKFRGPLGKYNQKEIPSCIMVEIKDHYPSPTGTYVGFKESAHQIHDASGNLDGVDD